MSVWSGIQEKVDVSPCTWRWPTPRPQWYYMRASQSENLQFRSESIAGSINNVVEYTCPHNITYNLCYPGHIVIYRLQLCFFCLWKMLEEDDILARHLLDPQHQKNCHRVKKGSEWNLVHDFSIQKTLGQQRHTIGPIKIQSGRPCSHAHQVWCRLCLHDKLLKPVHTKSCVKVGQSCPRGLRVAWYCFLAWQCQSHATCCMSWSWIKEACGGKGNYS